MPTSKVVTCAVKNETVGLLNFAQMKHAVNFEINSKISDSTCAVKFETVANFDDLLKFLQQDLKFKLSKKEII